MNSNRPSANPSIISPHPSPSGYRCNSHWSARGGITLSFFKANVAAVASSPLWMSERSSKCWMPWSSLKRFAYSGLHTGVLTLHWIIAHCNGLGNDLRYKLPRHKVQTGSLTGSVWFAVWCLDSDTSVWILASAALTTRKQNKAMSRCTTPTKLTRLNIHEFGKDRLKRHVQHMDNTRWPSGVSSSFLVLRTNRLNFSCCSSFWCDGWPLPELRRAHRRQV